MATLEQINNINYVDKKIRQWLLWMNGVSVHDKDWDECCPDFSCCNPEMKVHDFEVRAALGSDAVINLQFQRRFLLYGE